METVSLDSARSLRNLYFVRTAFQVIWAASVLTTAIRQPQIAAVLLLLYPVWDVACTVYDLKTSSKSGSARTSQIINAALGVGAAIGIGLTLFRQPSYSVAVFGVWAFGAGLLQLVLGLMRRKQLGGQWAMMLSDLESMVKEIITHLVEEHTSVLSWTDCFLLNAWAYKVFALTCLSEGDFRARLVRPTDLVALHDRLYPEGKCYLSVARCSEPRIARINIGLFRNSFLTTPETVPPNNGSDIQCFVGALRVADLLFSFAYLPPEGGWTLEIDAQFAGAPILWPAQGEITVQRTALPDITNPESLQFLFVETPTPAFSGLPRQE